MRIHIKQEDGAVRYIGIFQHNILFVRRKKSKHFYRKHNGWAIDKDVFNSLVERGLIKIHLLDIENAKVYKASVDIIKVNGIEINHSPHRPQICLPIEYWKGIVSYDPNK